MISVPETLGCSTVTIQLCPSGGKVHSQALHARPETRDLTLWLEGTTIQGSNSALNPPIGRVAFVLQSSNHMHDIPIIIIDSAPASHETEMQGPTGDLVWFHGHNTTTSLVDT